MSDQSICVASVEGDCTDCNAVCSVHEFMLEGVLGNEPTRALWYVTLDVDGLGSKVYEVSVPKATSIDLEQEKAINAAIIVAKARYAEAHFITINKANPAFAHQVISQ